MLGIIIQARLGSTRLPNKILKPFGDTSILLFLIRRLEVLNIPVLVATSSSHHDDALCEYLVKNDVMFYRGDEINVLSRFVNAAEVFGYSEIIRICSDNPFIDIKLLNSLIDLWKAPLDYLSYSYNSVPTILCHFGVFAEIVSLRALKSVLLNYSEPIYLEHVTSGVYNNIDSYNINLIELPKIYDCYSYVRLTVDTQEDYDNLVLIYSNLYTNRDFDFLTIGNFVLRTAALSYSMKSLIENNKKK